MDQQTEDAIYAALCEAWSDEENEEEVKKLQQNVDIQQMSPVDSRLELLDPHPNIHNLFQIFNVQFFWGKLSSVEVKWSPRMTQCAGICRYQTRSGYCAIGLSKPLLSLRPRKDLVQTLLHEMIHALLFVTKNNRDRDGHGPEFHKHMYRINDATGAAISVYHSFHNEVKAQQVHVWRCKGVCKDRPPFYGYVRRSMNRAPNKHDKWYPQHQASCGGEWEKIQEPEGYTKKKSKKKKDASKLGRPSIIDLLNKSGSTQTIKSGTLVPISSTSKANKDTSPLKSPTFQLPPGFKAFAGKGNTLGATQKKPNKFVRTKTPPSQPAISSFFVKSPPKHTQNNPKSSSQIPKSCGLSSQIAIGSSSQTPNGTSSQVINGSFRDSSPELLGLDSSEDFSDNELLILDRITSTPKHPGKRKRLDPPTTSSSGKQKVIKSPIKIINTASKHITSDITQIMKSPSKQIPCPFCNKSGFTDINIHVERCLEILSPDIIRSIENDSVITPSRKRLKFDEDVVALPDSLLEDVEPPTIAGDKPSTSATRSGAKPSDEGLPCPVCGKTGFKDINTHLNICLESLDDFDDMTEDRPTHSGHKPSSSVTQTGYKSSNASVIKKDPWLNELSQIMGIKKEEKGDDVIVLDRPVALCPVCNNYVYGDMNVHLDQCLKLFISPVKLK